MKKQSNKFVKNQAFTLLFIISGLNSISYADSIKVCTDDYPPSEMVLIKDDSRIGFANEIIKYIFEKNNFEVHFHGIPYERGVQLTKSGECDLIAQVIPEEDGLLHPKASLFRYENAYVVHADNDWVYRGADSLHEIRVGNIGGFDYSGDPEMEAFMNDESNNILTLRGPDATERIITMIAEDRVDTININTTIAWYYGEKLKIKDKLKIAPTSDNSKFSNYFDTVPAFSPVSDRSMILMGIWDRERAAMDDDFIEKYLIRYGVE